MDPEWTFHSPVRIRFQDHVLDGLGEIVPYDRVALITTPGFVKRGVAERVERSLGDRLVSVLDLVEPNPDLDVLDAERDLFTTGEPQALIALGGGSAIDTAKAAARLMSGEVSLSGQLREGHPYQGKRRVPIIAVPTTSGTGSEVTPFATIWDRASRKKYSIDGPDLLPEMALLDPQLTLGLSKEMTVSTGLDAISHALESAWNRRAGPISMALAVGSLRLSLESLPRLARDLGNVQARRSMMAASTMAGLAIAQTRTALAHSISYPITAELDVPHGLACGFALPEVLEFNYDGEGGRLSSLAKDLGYGSVQGLKEALGSLLEVTGADRMMLEMVGDPQEVLRRKAGMIGSSRATNNLRQADAADVEGILTNWARRVGKG
ncbi:Iron-containing alcohol dehydrogenase [anaerobic digester metagenome]